jgi:hypothetical protein
MRNNLYKKCYEISDEERFESELSYFYAGHCKLLTDSGTQ